MNKPLDYEMKEPFFLANFLVFFVQFQRQKINQESFSGQEEIGAFSTHCSRYLDSVLGK